MISLTPLKGLTIRTISPSSKPNSSKNCLDLISPGFTDSLMFLIVAILSIRSSFPTASLTKIISEPSAIYFIRSVDIAFTLFISRLLCPRINILLATGIDILSEIILVLVVLPLALVTSFSSMVSSSSVIAIISSFGLIISLKLGFNIISVPLLSPITHEVL